jgi:MOSC domain-containing protein YiiM
MKVVSVNVGMPREVLWHGERVLTSIFKDPVAGPVRVRTLNLDGDEQSDLTVHGGRDKSIYVYPHEHYAAWMADLPDVEFPMGAFGENLTVDGLSETTTRIGDTLRIGSVEAVVTQPRMPCFKLAIRFGRLDMPRRLMRSRRCGFYLRVVREGELRSGDRIAVSPAAGTAPTIADVFGRRS